MTYVSRKERVFALPDQEEGSSSVSLAKSSDHRMKIFPTVCERVAAPLDECHKYQQICRIGNEKEQPNKSRQSGFKFVPIDVLLTILMAEKDAYIKELVERQEKCTCAERMELLFKANQFDDLEDDKEALIRKDAEVVALKSKNAVLQSELNECRDTLGKAMHKLEDVEGILNENVSLNHKLIYAEEMLKAAEERNKALEIELENCGRRTGVITETEQNPVSRTEDDQNLLLELCNERNVLKQEVEELRQELIEANVSLGELDYLRRQYKELTTQNECLKKKLEATKELEKSVGDLTKRAQGLTEKYKRESNKANEQKKQIVIQTKDLQTIREERDLLKKKILELSAFESDYYSLKQKLSQFEMIVNEKEVLNSENEDLRREIKRLKDKIVQMEVELASQEDEIKNLVSQIQMLTNDYVEKREYNRLKIEYQETLDTTRRNEKELREMHILRSETENLRCKLQTCEDNIKSYEKSTKVIQDELHKYKEKCSRLEELSQSSDSTEPLYVATRFEEKVKFTNELTMIQELATETCPLFQLSNSEVQSTESTINNDSKTNICEKCSAENSSDKMNSLEQELNKMLEQTNNLQKVLALKNERIQELEDDIAELKNNLKHCSECRDLRSHCAKMEDDLIELRQINQKLQNQLKYKCEEGLRIEKLESSVQFQQKALEFSKRLIEEIEEKLWCEMISRKLAVDLSNLLKKEALLSRKEISVSYLTEIECLKDEINLRKELINEIQKENQILRNMKDFTDFGGKKALEKVLRKLKDELLILRKLSSPELEAECRALQADVKCLVEEGDNLKSALDAEKKSKEVLEKKLRLIQEEVSCIAKLRNESKNVDCATMTAEYEYHSDEIKKTLNEVKKLKEENDEFIRKIAALQDQCRDFEQEVSILQNNTDELKKSIKEERNITKRQKEEIDSLKEKIKICENEVSDFRRENQEFNQKAIALREELTAKEAELDRTKKETTDMKNEIIKLSMEMEVLKNRLGNGEDENVKAVEKGDEEKEESQDIVTNVEKEFEELRIKLENCKTSEEKLGILRTKRDNLIVKVKTFESEVQFLKRKLIECDVIKSELEQLKAEKKKMNGFQMSMESEEKLLSDIFGLREQIRLQQKEIERARTENTNLRDELQELGKVLESCKKLSHENHKTSTGMATSKDSRSMYDESVSSAVDSSTSCEKLGDEISVEEFKTEIAKIESKHKVKVQKLRDGNAEKIKKLMEQYEKESKIRNKIYNESLNNIKSNYENDIRKLVEKHKASIIRLQNLHEDEVQELNTNYETQMEAMQTLNKNVVNDLNSGAVEKCKLTEKYNKEIRDIESKFQRLLREKENEHKIEIANLQENLARNVDEQKGMHKQDIDNLTRMYENKIDQLREKHSRELKKLKKCNLKRTEVMRYKYEALLSEERKKYEEQLQIMLDRLKIGHQGDQIRDELGYVYLKKKTYSPGPLEFNMILQKIITQGLESLPFEELMLVHCKTCFAAESFFEDVNSRIEHEGNPTSERCIHMQLLKEDKEELLHRIFILENEIAIKQLETHEAIISMETAEKCRIEELNTLLRNEREKNTKLKKLLNNQTKAQTDLKIESYVLDKQAALHETNYIGKVKELEVERSETRRLEEELQKEKNNSKRLSLMLENERQKFRCQRKKDSDYIEAMRMRLDEALNHEQIMESQLDYEAQFRTKLEFELQSLQRSFNLIRDEPPAISLEYKTVKDIKNLDQFESEKEEKLIKCKNKVKLHKTSKF